VTRAARVTPGSLLLLLITGLASPAADAPAKKVLTFADEAAFRSSSVPVMSPDGKHIAYAEWPVEGDGESIVRHVPGGKEYRFARGPGGATVDPKFTPDGRHALLPLTPTKAATEKAKGAKAKPEEMPQPALAVVDLATGTVTDRFPQSGAFAVGGEGVGFVVYRKPAKPDSSKDDGKGALPNPVPPTAKGKLAAPPTPTTPTFGSDLHIRDLATKTDRTIADVSEFSLTRDGKVLVYAVNSKKDEGNGVFALDPVAKSAAEPIKLAPGRYSGLTWDEKQTKLAFLFDDSSVANPRLAPPPRPVGPNAGTVGPTLLPKPRYHAFVWDRHAKPARSAARDLPLGATGGFAALVPAVLAAHPVTIVPAEEVLGPDAPGLRPGWSLAGGTLAFSTDASKLFVQTAPKRDPLPPPGPPKPDDFQLDLWHWKDERLQPMQKLQAAADHAKTFLAVVNLDGKVFRQLSDEDVTVGRPQRDSNWALGSDNRAYRKLTGYGLPLSDYTAVNVKTGECKPLLKAFGGYGTPAPSLSPAGTHAAAFDGKDWFAVAVADGKRVNLTGKLKASFTDEEDDHPGSPPPAGPAQWSSDGKFLLVSDGFDLWKLAPDGSVAENLTQIGRGQHLRFGVVHVKVQDATEEPRGVDLSKPVLMRAENRDTRDTGFYRLDPGAVPKLLVMGARQFGVPVRAKTGDTLLLTAQTFAAYPDYYATTPGFTELKRVTDVNPKVKEFNWGTAELVRYTSADGAKLTGVLIKPENFDPAKKYPMVVYIYERLSDSLHQFRSPVVARGQVINPTFYASNGYLVLMPDIAYKVGAPGQSALKCVLPAVQAVADKGFVDERAIGIDGQSWGGYQIAYMVTQTDRFRAAVAGAPVSNMVSAYDGIRWGSGLTRQHQYEHTQSRIGATLWEAPMRFIENSPVFMADRVKTPLLMIHNDQDDAVPWYQGIEYYLALRRLGKECYLLNYNGEPHNLVKRAAARDFAARMFQFFEHHLKGKPEPAWMSKGVPHLDREKDKDEMKKLLGGK
jgi:dienelactone hydrolase